MFGPPGWPPPIKARIKAPKKDTVVGNLFYHAGYLISQTATDVSVFPLLDVRIKVINAALARRPNDPAALRDKLCWLRDHPEESQRMGQSGRQRILEGFTWPAVVRRCLDVYSGQRIGSGVLPAYPGVVEVKAPR